MVGKNRWPSLVWNQIGLLLFYLLKECDRTSSLLGRGKRSPSFPTVTEYFVKMNSLPEKQPTDYLCTIERFIIILCGRTSKHLHEHRHGLKHSFVRWKDRPYKGGLVPAHFKGSISRLALEQGKWLPSPANWDGRGSLYHKHQNIILTLWDMAVFDVEEVDKQLCSARPFVPVVVTVNTKCL